LRLPDSATAAAAAGDYGSMVNERVGAGNWESSTELGDTWAARNAFSYGEAVPGCRGLGGRLGAWVGVSRELLVLLSG
jgi:cobalamin biosynthesis Mg chelatase CobN